LAVLAPSGIIPAFTRSMLRKFKSGACLLALIAGEAVPPLAGAFPGAAPPACCDGTFCPLHAHRQPASGSVGAPAQATGYGSRLWRAHGSTFAHHPERESKGRPERPIRQAQGRPEELEGRQSRDKPVLPTHAQPATPGKTSCHAPSPKRSEFSGWRVGDSGANAAQAPSLECSIDSCNPRLGDPLPAQPYLFEEPCEILRDAPFVETLGLASASFPLSASEMDSPPPRS